MSRPTEEPAGARTGPSPSVRATTGRSWGLGEVWIGIAASFVVSGAAAIVALELGGWDEVTDGPLWVTALLTLSLEVALLAVAYWAATTKGLGVVTDFGIKAVSSDAGVGLLAGVLAQVALVPAITFPILWLTGTDSEEVGRSATELAERATTPIGVIALVLTVGVTAPIVEEIFFRGLVLRAFAKRRNMAWLEHLFSGRLRPDTTSDRWNVGVALLLSSMIFGSIHLQPLLFPALSAAGGVFAWLAYKYGRLGPAIWAHAAFNATTLLNLLVL